MFISDHIQVALPTDHAAARAARNALASLTANKEAALVVGELERPQRSVRRVRSRMTTSMPFARHIMRSPASE
jgi:hypothetical protein